MSTVNQNSDPSLEEKLILADEEMDFIMLTRGKFMSGKDFYAYIKVPPSKIAAFKQTELQSDYDLADYGEIIFWGYGEEPPPEVRKMAKEKYDFEDNFQEELDKGFKEYFAKQLKEEKMEKLLLNKIAEIKSSDNNSST